MKRNSFSILWLLVVIALSVVVLSKLEDWQQSRSEKQNVTLSTTATVMLVSYEGKKGEKAVLDGAEETRVDYKDEDFSLEREEIGCGDMLVPIRIPVVSIRLKSVLNALSEYEPLQGLHNPMNENGISVKHVSEKSTEGIIVDIVGEPKLGGTCDAQRLKWQIEKTIKLYQEEEAKIRLNGFSENYECMKNVFGRCS